MHIQNLKEIHKLIHKILSIITCIRYNMDLVYINAYTKFYQNSSICSKGIEEKLIFTSINSTVYIQIKPICNPKSLLPDINVHAKVEENRSKTTQVRVWKRSADGPGWTDVLTDGHLSGKRPPFPIIKIKTHIYHFAT